MKLDSSENNNEIWLDVVGYEGAYKISDSGRVKSIFRIVYDKNGKKKTISEKILIPVINNYYQVFLSINSKPKRFYIHYLVAKIFIKKQDGKNHVNHKDGNKLNNNASNLEWVTPKENIIHAHLIGIHKVGKDHVQAKKIVQLDMNNNIVKIWGCMNDIGKSLYGFKQGNISSACLGKLKTAYKFKWKFYEEYTLNNTLL